MAELRIAIKNDNTNWIELFLDLIYVVLISKITHMISFLGFTSVNELMKNYAIFLFFFLLLWQCWTGYMVAANRFAATGVNFLFPTLLHMIFILGMIFSINEPLKHPDEINYFIACFIITRLTICLIYAIAIRKKPNLTKKLNKIILTYTVPLTLLAVSMFISHPYNIILWVAYGAVGLYTPNIIKREYPESTIKKEHLIERLGNFTIIILGESLWSIVKHYSLSIQAFYALSHQTLFSALIVLISFFLICSIFHYYFRIAEFFTISKKTHPGVFLFYIHIPLYIGLITISSSLMHIMLKAEYYHFWFARMLLVGLVMTALSIDAFSSFKHGIKQKIIPFSRYLYTIVFVLTNAGLFYFIPSMGYLTSLVAISALFITYTFI